MNIGEIVGFLEELAPPSLQESYDNAGLITGETDTNCTGILISLDATEAVIAEAMERGCNLVVAHHPIVFKGLKKISGSGYVERTLLKAIRNHIAIYAIHTNLDNVVEGVSGKMAALLGLKKVEVLLPRPATLKKLYTYVPVKHLDAVRQALSDAGAGQIGNYSDCSFSVAGTGTFRGGEGTNPFVGKPGELHREEESRLEMIFPSWLESRVIRALKKNHPYEEVAFEVIGIENTWQQVGSGVIGEWETGIPEKEFVQRLHQAFDIALVRHTAFTGNSIRRVALCGGAGSFLISRALKAGVQAFVTADLKYHEFFDAEGRILLADIGHFESEQFTIDLLQEKLLQKFPTFAVLKTGVNTNPVRYSWQ